VGQNGKSIQVGPQCSVLLLPLDLVAVMAAGLEKRDCRDPRVIGGGEVRIEITLVHFPLHRTKLI